MYRYLKLGSKTLLVKPYTTDTELKVLEVIKLNEFKHDDDYEPIVDCVLERCLKIVPNLTKIEKIITVWYLRLITLGDEISLNTRCTNCNKAQNKIISVLDLFSEPSKYSEEIKPKLVSSLEFSDVLESLVDPELDIDCFDETNLLDYFFVYNNELDLNCDSCKSTIRINLLTFKECLNFLSEESLESLTTWLHILVYSDNLSRQDVLSMTPVERMLEINYFKEQNKRDNNGED